MVFHITQWHVAFQQRNWDTRYHENFTSWGKESRKKEWSESQWDRFSLLFSMNVYRPLHHAIYQKHELLHDVIASNYKILNQSCWQLFTNLQSTHQNLAKKTGAWLKLVHQRMRMKVLMMNHVPLDKMWLVSRMLIFMATINIR